MGIHVQKLSGAFKDSSSFSGAVAGVKQLCTIPQLIEWQSSILNCFLRTTLTTLLIITPLLVQGFWQCFYDHLYGFIGRIQSQFHSYSQLLQLTLDNPMPHHQDLIPYHQRNVHHDPLKTLGKHLASISICLPGRHST